MSETVYNVIAAHSLNREALQRFIDETSRPGRPLIGSRVSKRWRKALIEDLHFEYLEDVRRKSKWPEDVYFATSTIEYDAPRSAQICCAYYAFYSRAFGGGLTDYFLEASLRFPSIRFVVQWLYPSLGEIGVQEIEAASIVGEEFYELSARGERFFREVAKDYFGLEFSKSWFCCE